MRDIFLIKYKKKTYFISLSYKYKGDFFFFLLGIGGGIEINAFTVILHLFLLIKNILREDVSRKLEAENMIISYEWHYFST